MVSFMHCGRGLDGAARLRVLLPANYFICFAKFCELRLSEIGSYHSPKLGVTCLLYGIRSYHSLKLADKYGINSDKGIVFHSISLWICHGTLLTHRYIVHDTFPFKPLENTMST